MSTPDMTKALIELDELTELELHIAQRADELMRQPANDGVCRDFWLEAEREIWAARLRQSRNSLAC